MHALRAKPKKEWKDKKSGKGTTKMFLTLWNASLMYTYTCIYIHSRSSPGRRYCHLLLQEQDHFTIAEQSRTEQCHCSSGRGELCLKTHTKNHVVRIAIKQHPRQKEEKAANSYNMMYQMHFVVPDLFTLKTKRLPPYPYAMREQQRNTKCESWRYNSTSKQSWLRGHPSLQPCSAYV